MEHDLYRIVYDINIPSSFDNFGVRGSLKDCSKVNLCTGMLKVGLN